MSGDIITVMREVATFAGGCFWCIEAVFQMVRGVEKVLSGYTGGKTQNPTYEEVSSGETGHAEAVQVTYDPKIIRYEDLLYIFWKLHDPTSPNRQGPDIGSQYRSAIFYHNEKQREAALKSKRITQRDYREKIVVTIPTRHVVESSNCLW